MKPFNYERCNLWYQILIFGVIWIAFLASITIISPSSTKGPPILLIFLFIGWAILAIFGALIQAKFPNKYPSKLYFAKKVEIELFIRFQLSRRDEINFASFLNESRFGKSTRCEIAPTTVSQSAITQVLHQDPLNSK